MKSKPKNLHIILALVLITTFLVPVPFIAHKPDAGTAMQGPVGELAGANPDQMVRVIVQKTDLSDQAERLVEQLGGQVVKDLHMINAFAAEMSALAATWLSQSDAVNWVSLDAPVERSGKPNNDPCAGGVCPPNFYLDTLGVRQVWDMGFQGQGVAVAVIDSGLATDRDFTTQPGKPFTRIVKQISFSANSFSTSDEFGHGTHVAGIIGGHGGASGGVYAGVAPKIDLINLKISDEQGMAYESDTVEALQWVLDNKDQYNIRVVNLSVNSTLQQSYHTSAMDAAAEILWFNGVVVVVSAGNNGGAGNEDAGILYPPANDPFLITVGASDENGSSDPADDTLATFSSYGTTEEGHLKPDLIAPGRNIISVLASSSDWEYDHPDRIVLDGEYFRISGTSMSAPMVTGAVALLLQAEPNLTPDQVKYRLTHAAGTISGQPYLDVHAALTTPTTESANTGIQASQLLWTGEDPITWNSVNWNSVNWNSVNWNSVNWNSVNWNSVNWNSVNWND